MKRDAEQGQIGYWQTLHKDRRKLSSPAGGNTILKVMCLNAHNAFLWNQSISWIALIMHLDDKCIWMTHLYRYPALRTTWTKWGVSSLTCNVSSSQQECQSSWFFSILLGYFGFRWSVFLGLWSWISCIRQQVPTRTSLNIPLSTAIWSLSSFSHAQIWSPWEFNDYTPCKSSKHETALFTEHRPATISFWIINSN